MLKCTDHSFCLRLYHVLVLVSMLYDATQKTRLRGVCRSYRMHLPSGLKNSCPLISMFIVRGWTLVRPVPSVRTIHVRSMSCQVPSWQNNIWCGSVGENCTWFSQARL